MTEEMQVALKYPRGTIKEARVKYGQALNDDNQNEFRAWIYMGKGKATYAEMQATVEGHNDIKSWFEYGDNPDVGPRYMDNGDITHRSVINSLDDWTAWLKEYVSGFDPLDHFRFYREAVGGF